MKKVVVLTMGAALLLSSCGTYTGAGAYTGGMFGSMIGSAIGGISGGYKLAKKPSEYTVGEILRVMEGELCPLSNFENNTLVSEGSRVFWKDFETTINQYVDSVHLDELAEKNKEYVGYDYCI